MQCTRCAGEHFTKAGRDRQGRQLYRCRVCNRRITERSGSTFSGYRFPKEVIALAVRWYLRYRLSYADVAEWLAERGITVDLSTIYDWVRVFTPCFIAAARAHRSTVGRRWRVDETYIKTGTRWHELFRAIDEHGQIVDVYLSDRRDRAAAEAFFVGALQTTTVTPSTVTTDTAKCYPPAVRTLLPNVEHRTSKYLNNGTGTGSPAFEGTHPAHAAVQNDWGRQYLLPRPCVDAEPGPRALIARCGSGTT